MVEIDEVVKEHLDDFEKTFSDLLPSCTNCDKWTIYSDTKGICNSRKFITTNENAIIMTARHFFCADFKPKRKIDKVV